MISYNIVPSLLPAAPTSQLCVVLMLQVLGILRHYELNLLMFNVKVLYNVELHL